MVASLTVNVATPDALVATLAGEIVEEPAPWPRLTVLPEMLWPCASFSVTVIVEVVELSATTDDGDAETVEAPALTGPTVKLTAAVCVTVTESVVSVAV